jgi:hypothetical protein
VTCALAVKIPGVGGALDVDGVAVRLCEVEGRDKALAPDDGPHATMSSGTARAKARHPNFANTHPCSF